VKRSESSASSVVQLPSSEENDSEGDHYNLRQFIEQATPE